MASASEMPPTFTSIDHLKLPAHDIGTTVDFYTSVLPFTKLPQFDHFTPPDQGHKLFASMLTHEPTKLILEVRLAPAQAAAQKGWDPITWGVHGGAEELEAWGKWLDAKKVKRSRVFVAIKGWVLAFEDPDGRIVRLYCDAVHEWTERPDHDEFWLGSGKEA